MPAQLRKRGLDPGEIPVVVMTHMHLDHTSAISEFPNSTFILSETEWEAAATGSQPLLNGYRRPHFDYAFDYRTIDFDRSGVDSYATFGRSFDLFGDGSIRLAFTPGHSAGHMSVIAHLSQRRLRDRRRRDLHPGPARGRRAAGAAPLRRPQLPPLAAGAEALQAASTPTRSITPGHDAGFYAGLERPLRVTSAPYISRTRAKISLATSSWRSRLGSSSVGKLERLAELDRHLGEAEALPAAHRLGAVDRDWDDRRAGFQRDPADARLGLAELAAARAAALGVDEQHLALVEDRAGRS